MGIFVNKMHIAVVVLVMVLIEMATKWLHKKIKRLLSHRKPQKPKEVVELEEKIMASKKELGEVSGFDYIKKQREIQRLEKQLSTYSAPIQGKKKGSMAIAIGADVSIIRNNSIQDI